MMGDKNQGPLLDGIYHHKEFELKPNSSEKRIKKITWVRFLKTGVVEVFARDSWIEFATPPQKITMMEVGYNGDPGEKEKYFIGFGNWSLKGERCYFEYSEQSQLKQFEIDMRGGDRRFIQVFPLGNPNTPIKYIYLQMKRFLQLKQRIK